MRISFCRLLAVLFLVLGVSLFAQTQGPAETKKDGIAALVNDEVVTYTQVISQTQMQEFELKTQKSEGRISDEDYKDQIRKRRRAVMESLIEVRLILQEYKKKGFSIPEYYFTVAEKDKLRDRFGGDRQALQKTLEENGLTVADWRKQVREEYIVSWMRRINTQRMITISPQQIEDYYQQHIRDFLQPERIRLRMIQITSEKHPNAEETTEEVLRSVESGVDFAALALKYSDYNPKAGGLFQSREGWAQRGDLRSDFAEVAFRLRPGQTSQILKVEKGEGRADFFILHVEEIRKATVTPLAGIRQSIEGTLEAKENEKIQQAWIERLKRGAYIQRFL